MRALIVLVVLASTALADSRTEAKQHMDAAAVAYKAGHFDETLAELEKAYALEPRPELHYSIGQVYVKLDRCSDAIGAYERFLATNPSPDRAELANQAIEVCKTQLAARPAPTPAPAPVPEPVLVQPAVVDEAPAWYQDRLGLGLVGTGAVISVVGLVLYADARGKADDAANAIDYAESQRLYDSARSQRTTSIIVSVVGVAAIGVGGWRLWSRRSEDRRRNLAVVPTTSGGVVTFSGTF
jgi:tetratricopeptide (TPR) repeat protein